MPRSDIKNAPYNPRTISDDARKRLKDNLERVGLIEPIIWNRRSGHIVGGHQRLKALDALEESPDYLVPCAVVDLDETTEKAQNVFLNNGEAQGGWDLDLLADVLKDVQDVSLAGFDHGDLYQLYGTNPLGDSGQHVEELAAGAQAAKERFEALRQAGYDREAKHFYLVVVFGGDEDREQFTTALGLPDNRYIDGRKLLNLLKRTDGPTAKED